MPLAKKPGSHLLEINRKTAFSYFQMLELSSFGKKTGKETMSNSNLQSLSFLERKEYEELKKANSAEAKRRKERIVFLGFFAISLLATLLISGALDFF